MHEIIHLPGPERPRTSTSNRHILAELRRLVPRGVVAMAQSLPSWIRDGPAFLRRTTRRPTLRDRA